MLGEIRALPAEVVDLIAAGEVIDSLAAVVRELVENSLDAEANRISVSIVPESWQVRVTDNGKGMSLKDLKACVKPHSTSKIRSREDLWHITSLGFRGEALHSIAQVAQLEICSRSSAADSVGWKASYKQGKLVTEEAVAIAPGTTVTAIDLFEKIPVRRRGLPPFPQQLKTIQKIIYQIALCHPQVTWQIKLQEKLWFSLSPGKNARDILPQILKRIKHDDLHYLKLEIPTPSNESEMREDTETERLGEWLTETNDNSQSPLELIIGLPDRCHRHRADWVKVAVNRRFVRSPELEQTMLNGMAKTLPRDRFPVCLLHLQTCPSQIDWNRHPAKTEIYLHSLTYWQTEVARAIERALKFDSDNLPQVVSDRRIGKILQVAEARGKYHLNNELNPPLIGIKKPKISSLTLKVVAQVNKTYIVAEHATGMWLIEQHIAHERVLYEQLQDDWQLVPIETPLVLNNLIPRQIEQLEKLGMAIEPFGENLWAVRNIPQMLARREDCSDALLELSWGGDLRTAQVATACRSAIRNGTPLTMEEMQNLVNCWQATRNPRTCPHGRPIYLSLEETELSRFFRRHWVIGKSHGI
ncbi:DNA mismatch repair endonuclease MutL [Myxosarcina sp. GI1]|uniref:DNA mismatch repair endonuclease MutL n=1 Tax=Myxosarcina sp. GI1 TaxID=1541065 RepID=UPI00055FFB6C|nr:DNA mismatch repair endonuclease MutL [Myxosarcina sp. GI1]